MIPMKGMTDRQEMGGREEKMRAGKLPGLFEREREPSTSPGWGGKEGGFLCALFRAEVLTEGP